MESRETAKKLHTTTTNGARTVLFVGNSLVVHGIDSNTLQEEIAPRYYCSVFAVENTQYLDWYFGIRTLFTEGCRPSILILCLTTRQLISDGTDGEYFAHYMMLKRDIFRVKKEAHLDTTVASNLFFANLSAWLGSRAMIRNWLLEKLMPSVQELTTYFPEEAPPMLPADDVAHQGITRLQELKELCENNGTSLMFVIPPLSGLDKAADTLRVQAAAAGITVLIPYRGGEMPLAYFSDGFHLNNQGAARFTAKLGSELVDKAITQK